MKRDCYQDAKDENGATLFFCTDAFSAAAIGKLNSDHKWKLFEMSKILGMGCAKYENQLGIHKLAEFDEVIPYNSFSGVSYIGICQNKKWGLIKITEDENSTLLKFDCNLIENVNYADIQQLEKKYSIMTWIDGIKEYLGVYKSKKYEDVKDGQYKDGRYYPHIFPCDCRNLNLLETYRDDFLQSDWSKKINFHLYFHHLNSSQAMCINFFYPLIIEKKIEMILKKLGLENEKVDYTTVKFEKESDIDNKNGARSTIFDFYFKTESKKEFYFEIKYTENEFGNAKKDAVHEKKYHTIYQEAAQKNIKPVFNNCVNFLANYQIMRNLIHVSENSYVVFIIPKNNTKIKTQADDAKDIVIETYKDKVKVLYWDCLYELIEEQKWGDKLKIHFEEFKRKYKLGRLQDSTKRVKDDLDKKVDQLMEELYKKYEIIATASANDVGDILVRGIDGDKEAYCIIRGIQIEKSTFSKEATALIKEYLAK
jgi:hypothetical protein